MLEWHPNPWWKPGQHIFPGPNSGLNLDLRFSINWIRRGTNLCKDKWTFFINCPYATPEDGFLKEHHYPEWCQSDEGAIPKSKWNHFFKNGGTYPWFKWCNTKTMLQYSFKTLRWHIEFGILISAPKKAYQQHLKSALSPGPPNPWERKLRKRMEQWSLISLTPSPGWWFQPIWKILVKMGIFPK